MALQKKTIRLLILEDSQNEAERLVSLFRNAGQATRVHRLTSSDDLAEALQQTWDLLICARRARAWSRVKRSPRFAGRPRTFRLSSSPKATMPRRSPKPC